MWSHTSYIYFTWLYHLNIFLWVVFIVLKNIQSVYIIWKFGSGHLDKQSTSLYLAVYSYLCLVAFCNLVHLYICLAKSRVLLSPKLERFSHSYSHIHCSNVCEISLFYWNGKNRLWRPTLLLPMHITRQRAIHSNNKSNTSKRQWTLFYK